MRVLLGVFGASLLLASLALAGANGSVSPYVRSVDGELSAGSAVGKQGEYVEYRVGACGYGAVKAVHVDLEYDPAGLRFEGFVSGDLFEDPLVLGPFDRVERHVVDVTTATLLGAVSGAEGSVGVFRFRVLDPAHADVRLVSFQTADGAWSVETQVSYANAVGVSRLPGRTGLRGNVPNPFNPTTEIGFGLSESGPAELSVYNVSGQRVRVLVSGSLPAGVHSVVWDGRDATGSAVSSGVYFARLVTERSSDVKRMTLLR